MRTYRVCFKTVYSEEYQVTAPSEEGARALATLYVQAVRNGLPTHVPPYAGRMHWVFDDGTPYQDEPDVRRVRPDGTPEFWNAPDDEDMGATHQGDSA
jgi:hypothetical protein